MYFYTNNNNNNNNNLRILLLRTILPILLLLLLLHKHNDDGAQAISIKPADFDRLVMSCYLGGSSSGIGAGPSSSSSYNAYQQFASPQGGSVASVSSSSSNGYVSLGRQGDGQRYGGQTGSTNRHLGQQVPRANTIDNFIALVSKVEAASPRLANNPDQLIRALLGRFRLDNYYYDTRARTPISEQDHRTMNIIPALLGGQLQQQQQQQPYGLSADDFPEHLLDHDEKCSMYFMLSHFIERTSSGPSAPLASQPISQLTGPLGGQRTPNLQAAGSGYPAVSANQALGGAQGGRYAGPAPAFGSPATQNMNSFGSGLTNQPDHATGAQYGLSVLQPNNGAYQQQQQRNLGSSSSSASSSSFVGVGSQSGRYPTPYLLDGSRPLMGRPNAAANGDDLGRRALEFGVVSVGGQTEAALVLNRVLMGLLAAQQPSRTLRQLAELIYPTQPLLTTSPRLDNNIDPLYAVTLADLWAVSSIPKADKPLDFRLLGDNGRWNDTMCPTVFQLDRPNSIRFTTAELIGGLDGLNLGLLRRELLERRKQLRLSDLLRMYYTKQGFRGQFAEVGVCNRASAINSRLDELRRQAEDYLRLHQLNVPTNDNEISLAIQRLDSFKELARQAAQQFAPAEICFGSQGDDTYGGGGPQQPECELAKADMVTVLDTSLEAHEPFQRLVVAKLAQKAGLSRQGNSLTILTNQQDTTGYAGSYSFNAILSNSTNTAEIGCSLQYDQSRAYQGGQVTEPTRLMEMFERALVQLDSEYLLRQNMGSSSSGSPNYNNNNGGAGRPSTYASSWFTSSGQAPEGSAPTSNAYYALSSANNNLLGGPKATGGSKVIVWFNFGHQMRPQSPASYQTNWNDPKYQQAEQAAGGYKFQEARRYLRENFRGASILALATNRDHVKQFVFDEERDIFTDLPTSSSSSSSMDSILAYGGDGHQQADPMLAGRADQMAQKLLQRMCDIPAVFQYPMCFRQPSDNTQAVGYISPQRKQYWIMAPKSFFSSKTVRLAFKVEGGRLRVCFGRSPRPDEFAQRNGQMPNDFGVSILNNQIGPQQPGQQQQQQRQTNPLSGHEQNGICKDVSPGQEIDFMLEEPCYKRPIAECDPFYFVLKEISQPGEGDINYMCRDEGCKRLDQAKFTLSHTGIACSSAPSQLSGPSLWLLMISSLLPAIATYHQQLHLGSSISSSFSAVNTIKGSKKSLSLLLATLTTAALVTSSALGQQAGVHDFGQNRYGERRGNLTPSEVLAIILLLMVILAGLALAIGLCYYVSKQQSSRRSSSTPKLATRSPNAGMTRLKSNEY